MRIFIALDVDPKIRQRIANFIEQHRSQAPDARWAKVENLHITLKFIGEVEVSRVQLIQSALADIRCAAIPVVIEDLGVFGNRKIEVLWAGITASRTLQSLVAAINELPPLNLETAQKRDEAYTPHLTLARIALDKRGGEAPKRALDQLLNNLKSKGKQRFGTMAARDFVLYQSKTSPAGSQYFEIQRFPLS